MLTAYMQSLRGSHRNVLLVFSVSALLGFSVNGGINEVIYNLYLLRLGYQPDTIGRISAVGLLCFSLGSLLAGWLGTAWSIRKTALVGLLLILVGAVMLPLASSVPEVQRVAWLSLCALISYTGLALYYVNALPYVLQVTTVQNRSKISAALMAVGTAAMVGGGLTGGVLPGLFASALGLPVDSAEPYRWTLALVPLFLLVAVLVFMQTRDSAGYAEQYETMPDAETGSALYVTYGLIGLLGFVRFLQVAALAGGLTFFNVYLDKDFAVPTYWVGTALAVARLVGVPAALLGPEISRRLGLGKTVVVVSVLTAVSVLPLALLRTPLGATAGVIGIVVTSNIRYQVFNIYTLEVVPVKLRPMMAGVNEMAAGLSFALVALVGGLVIVRYGYSELFLACGAITMLSAFAFAAFLRRQADAV